ncbi:MAG: RagB/SusD family nutrient uptake outer membrane protein, partial [Balneolales bacterium]
MKKLTFITIYIIAIVAISCTDLSLAPHSQINEQNYYRNADDMNNAVHAAYASLRHTGVYSSGMIRTGEQRSDNTATTWTPGNAFDIDSFYTFTMNSQNTHIQNVWDDHFNGIMRSNVVLDRIESVEMDSSLKEQYRGEASFLRGLLYFNLVRIFGDVPIVVTQISSEEANQRERDPIESVYNQIIEDLEYAEVALLSASYTSNDIGRATSSAATGLLAKVFLTQHNYENAREKLEIVINSGNYDLLPD